MTEGEKDTKKGTRRITTVKKAETARMKAATPEAPPPPAPETKKPPEQKKAAKKKTTAPSKTILIADDNTPIRNIIKQYMINEGYDVMEASDGEQVLTALAKKIPDLILMDVMMPKMDGYTLTKTLRNKPEFSKIPIVMCSAKGRKEDVIEAIKAGANDYVVKPFTRDIIMQKIKKLLETDSTSKTG